MLERDKPRRALEDDPLWYKDAIIYELHVKAFFDSSGDGAGDFRGLTEKLDYLVELGITAIWLLPFYPSPMRDDGYDISDYRAVHPAYGTLRDFRVFLREAHSRGLRVITELVINHTSDQHPWFQAARRAKPGSARRDYYVWSDTDQRYAGTRIIFCDTETSNWAWDPLAQAYYWHRFYSHQPDLNLNNPRVVREVIRVLRYWLDLGVDGLRLDAIPYLCEREGTNNENLPETHEVLKQIRAAVDTHYENRMLLAEANQWPADVRPYFGDGDECHMAFHFPLMPRVYIALRREDSEPIVEIMQETPEIPKNCQWGLFLRNHDELTLEMVTNEERDYMWREYAKDARMRLNLGIRRRLAPLVDNSFRRLELLNSILFSFPGTPILYYGDEIGMGDNIFLGDRDGVRTPMQWSADRNAGFSRADPGRLYLPVIMDPVYGYQAVNVEAQERDPSSLLNFMKRMLALRRQYRAFSRGTLEFLRPKNRKVLVYFRKYREEVLLCVVNLSRFAQPVELDLSKYQGWFPVEIFGRTEFPRIGTLPYFLTLGSHGFYWFKLEPAPQPIYLEPSAHGELPNIGTIMTEDLEQDIFEQRYLRSEIEEALAAYLEEQVWYDNSGKSLIKLTLREAVKIGARLYAVIVAAAYDDNSSEEYMLPLRVVVGETADRIAQEAPYSLVAYLKTAKTGGLLVDASADRTACQILLQLMYNERSYGVADEAHVTGRSRRIMDSALQLDSTIMDIRLSAESQTSSSIMFGEALILKLFRKVEPGIHPELEIERFLREQTDFRNFAEVAGWIQLDQKSAPSTVLAVCHSYVRSEGSAWAHAVLWYKQFAQRYDEVRARREEAGSGRIMVELPEEPRAAIELIARRTAELHLAVSSNKESKAFRPVPYNEHDVRAAVDETLSNLTRLVGDLTAVRGERGICRELVEDLVAESDRVEKQLAASRIEMAAACSERKLLKIRCHNNLKLHQVLMTQNDVVFIDFEGNTALPIAMRRLPRLGMVDAASLVRSFADLSVTTFGGCDEEDHEKMRRQRELSQAWGRATRALFLSAYQKRLAGTPLAMPEPAASVFSRMFMLSEVVRSGLKREPWSAYREKYQLLILLLDHVFPLFSEKSSPPH